MDGEIDDADGEIGHPVIGEVERERQTDRRDVSKLLIFSLFDFPRKSCNYK